MGSSPALDQKFFVQVILGLTFRNFFLFCKRIDVQKLPKGPFLHFWALCDLPETKKSNFQFFPHAVTVEKNTWHFEVLFLFLSLRYGADLGRSRIVFQLSRFRCTGFETATMIFGNAGDISGGDCNGGAFDSTIVSANAVGCGVSCFVTYSQSSKMRVGRPLLDVPY